MGLADIGAIRVRRSRGDRTATNNVGGEGTLSDVPNGRPPESTSTKETHDGTTASATSRVQ